MKPKTKRRAVEQVDSGSEICELCKRCDDCPDKYGEKITLEEPKLTVHYFCLLMSSGIFQRGKEHEGIHGFLVDDIKKEACRSSRLRCTVCKKMGASVGCAIKSCRQMVHLPCGIKQEFIFQFTDLFPSFCRKHCPTQICSSSPTLPLSCSICLEPIEPVLSYTVLKCPACHGSWFHRACVQNQAHSAALYFFRCTLCNNSDQFQQEMLRMGIHIPERDASWELEENAYGELLQVYQHCDAIKCSCEKGRSYSAQSGFFEIVRCTFCGSRGTHRKCSFLKLYETNWSCDDCKTAVEGTVSPLPNHVKSPLAERQEKKRLIKRCLSSISSSFIPKRFHMDASPSEILMDLATQISTQQTTAVLVIKDEVVEAALQAVRQSDFSPCHTLSVSFSRDVQSQKVGTQRRFLRLLLQKLRSSSVFEGPDQAKNLALSSQALRDDLYFEIGSLLALSLVHGGPPVAFFSRALYYSLFHYPTDYKFTAEDLGDVTLTHAVKKIAKSSSLPVLRRVVRSMMDYLQVAGCWREITKLSDKNLLLEDILNFYFVIRMQVPLQRFREGLRTLGVFDRVQACPEAFCSIFCGPEERMTSDAIFSLFTACFSEDEEQKAKEYATMAFWKQYIHECEDGRCAASLEDILIFATGIDVVPAMSFDPPPSLSFFVPLEPSFAFPQSHTETNHLILPLLSSYELFKKHLEYAVCQISVMQGM
ncbi:G2/M phase-specific E3 ubiquitin-protein ligase isoform X1 [Ictalurus punctatus]|uniref:G2/M phase-specific E3 ubiquitin-protein ligase n=2 Tax=Ictalurus punctatus TaxID=7998 RepID=W5UGM2_ICTPU|nr:G2/M phase-specific E3 ubiquitin-protein ligase isoform X1 [Ictalurus punctatus]